MGPRDRRQRGMQQVQGMPNSIMERSYTRAVVSPSPRRKGGGAAPKPVPGVARGCFRQNAGGEDALAVARTLVLGLRHGQTATGGLCDEP